jgi:predicted delta-1-pyrroline-5-carboxylate dehydrogenase group 2
MAAHFQNEPLTDFSRPEAQRQMVSALRQARSQLGREIPLVIGGREQWREERIVSVNPAVPDEVIGSVSRASIADADTAVGSLRSSREDRIFVLERAAEIIADRRFELAALIILEAGKNWQEADADVAEAIDFCRFYAREMRRLREPQGTEEAPGESNHQHYLPRGVGAVIAPWNFPLAILTGMTVAALVTGNGVVMKPAEESPVIAFRLFEILREAGAQENSLAFLPGLGPEVGAHLAAHPGIDFVGFTGSRETGLSIWAAAGRTEPGQRQLKKVICEMGGKNAMIVDRSASLDDATLAIVRSAFGYSGQKCSALSRLIVEESIYAPLLDSVIEQARQLRVGFPEDPATFVGPLISAAARDRVNGFIELGRRDATLLWAGETPEGAGYFVPPVLFTNVPAESRIAREEIFGPVLCTFKVRDFNEALAMANDTEFALTGGVFSRDRANIEQAIAGFDVGNLYINRAITGALVGRQPFGGFKMSGGGTKAGGRDYLLHFLLPRVVTERL